MKKATYAFSILLIIICTVAAYANTLVHKEIDESLKAKIDKIFAEWDNPETPGCALAVIQDGEIVYKRGYGIANLDYNIPITSKTEFDIGSTSKQFTAACIALLIAEGKLSLDDDIRTYIPELPEYESSITVRHLLHHTSGVRDYLTLMGLSGMEAHNVYSDQDIVDLLAHQKNLNFAPGKEYLYSNSGYILLAVIVKRVSGMSMGEYANKHIFEPLGMTNTFVYEDRTRIIKNRAIGYSKDDKGVFHVDHFFNFDLAGDGQIYTTVEDLLLWDRNFYDLKVGGKNFISLMLTQGSLNSGKTLDYALGLMHGKYKGLKTVHHGGAWGGFRAQMIRISDHKFSVVVLSNLGSISPTKLAHKVIDLLLADHIQPDKEKKEAEKSQEKPATIDPAVYDAYVGKYQLEMGLLITITKEDNRLWAKVAGQQKIELFPISEATFDIKVVDAQVSFHKDDKGKVTKIVLHQGGQDMPGKKIEAPPLTQEQLAEYAGNYYSDELLVTYKLVMEEDKLFAYVRKQPRIEIEITEKDKFSGAMFRATIERAEDGEVIGFSLDAGRVKNLKFKKIEK
ncbi:MAG: serine hydrolase [Candidatus Aminicenantes bacterium]|nr:MAG: serine hydrolase [Candidatus Aminicenantes bacterium]